MLKPMKYTGDNYQYFSTIPNVKDMNKKTADLFVNALPRGIRPFIKYDNLNQEYYIEHPASTEKLSSILSDLASRFRPIDKEGEVPKWD